MSPGSVGRNCLRNGAEAPLPDEADAGGILLLRGGKAVLPRDRTDLGLGQAAHGEERAGELLLPQRVQEVGLVLSRVRAAQEAHLVPFAVQAAEVACRDAVRAGCSMAKSKKARNLIS